MIETLVRRLGLGAILLLLLLATAPAEAGRTPAAEQTTAAQLAQAIARAEPGAVIEVNGGAYEGSLVIDRPLTLIGRGWPVLDGQGEDTVLQITAPDTTIEGFLIRNSGDSLDEENSGIAVEAENVTVAGNRFENTLFGIYLREANGSTLRDNVIQSKDLPVPRRGDGIRVWYSSDVTIEDNRVEEGRDVVLWYSKRITVRRNDVQRGRYGLHFMYCDDALIEENRLLDNSVGAFLMYSRRMTMARNTIAGNRGPSGYGAGLKDMDDAIIRDNLFLDNRVGVYLDGSPREVDSVGRLQGNVFAYNDIGVEMLPAVRHNEFIGNSFIENEEQVAIAGGGGRPEANEWTVGNRGNYWSDYAGYDANGDRLGDIKYEADRLFEQLMQRKPALRLFLYSPATDAIDFAARAFPLVKPEPKLVDEKPMMAPQTPVGAPPLPDEGSATWFWLAPALVLLSLFLIALPRLQRSRYIFPSATPSRTVS